MNQKYNKRDPSRRKGAASGEQTGENLRSEEELMSTRQLMEFLNLSRTKIWELVNKEGLPAFKIGGDYRYRRSEVLQWLETYRVKK